jgi:DNA-binding IclR family transcriptional regulator
VRRGDQRQCLFRVESPHLLRLHVREGDMLPMDSSATAQILRVFGSRPLPAYALTIELPVYTVGVTDPHTASLATPVFGTSAELLGALTISAPLSRLTPERVEAMKTPLNTAAAELTRALGGFFPDLDRSAPAPAEAIG